VARQVAVCATEIAFYEWSGRTIEFHRAQIRKALGFRECSVADAEALVEWLVTNVTHSERSGERVREQLMARCRDERIEPPTSGRIDRIIRSALSRGEDLLFAQVSGRLSVEVRSRMLALIAAGDDDEAGDPSVLASIRSDVGNVSLNTMLTEIAKLEAVRAVALPGDVFADVTPKVVTAWRGRAAVESPSHLRDHATDVALTLLSALLYWAPSFAKSHLLLPGDLLSCREIVALAADLLAWTQTLASASTAALRRWEPKPPVPTTFRRRRTHRPHLAATS
jgi:hypothetical protein